MIIRSLQDLIQPAGARAGTDSDHPVYSVTKHEGFVRSTDYFKKQVFSRDLTSYRRVTPGDFAYATIHLDEGSIGIAPADGLISPMYTVFRPFSELIDPRYLLRYLKSPVALAQYPRFGNGSVHRRKSISLGALGKLPVPLPPVEDQKRIADMLDHLDRVGDIQVATRRKIDELQQSIFFDMFGRMPASHKLADGCLRITDGTHQTPEWTDSGVPFVFISNMATGTIDFETKRFISEDKWRELTRSTPVELGDVLYSTVGASYGISAVVRTDRPFAFQRHIAHLKPDPTRFDSEFLGALMSTPLVKLQADRAARGAAQPTVNLTDIKQFDVVMPPLTQQVAFTRRLGAISAASRRAEARSHALKELFASLQSRAFRGEL